MKKPVPTVTAGSSMHFLTGFLVGATGVNYWLAVLTYLGVESAYAVWEHQHPKALFLPKNPGSHASDMVDLAFGFSGLYLGEAWQARRKAQKLAAQQSAQGVGHVWLRREW